MLSDSDLDEFAKAFLTEKQYEVLLKYLRDGYDKKIWSANEKKHLKLIKNKVIDLHENKNVARELYNIFYLVKGDLA